MPLRNKIRSRTEYHHQNPETETMQICLLVELLLGYHTVRLSYATISTEFSSMVSQFEYHCFHHWISIPPPSEGM